MVASDKNDGVSNIAEQVKDPCPEGLWWHGWGFWDEPTCTICGEEYGDHAYRR